MKGCQPRDLVVSLNAVERQTNRSSMEICGIRQISFAKRDAMKRRDSGYVLNATYDPDDDVCEEDYRAFCKEHGLIL
jgi:hypothetical protein